MGEAHPGDDSWVNTEADRFEQAWKGFPKPRIEDYLANITEPRHGLVLLELIQVERQLRQRDGEEPIPEDYRWRFPKYSAVVDAVFGGHPTNPAPIEPSGDTDDDFDPVLGSRVSYFGDYELIRVLGRGGMGVVYEARQIRLNRRVALKMIRSARRATEDEQRRFEWEAEAIAKLDHPHIVPIYEFGQHQGRLYFAMKLLDGGSLKKRGNDLYDDPRASALLIEKVANAVDYAHKRGILHRDLNPANVLLDNQGEPCVTDFGLAKRVNDDSELTQSGMIMGTPAYMAPEQTSGRREEVTISSDVYGLGATLYFLLAGRLPFEGKSIMETLDQVCNSAPSLPSKINPRVPRDLETICLKAIAKKPASRYSTAGELAVDLDRFLNGEPIKARPVSVFERGWRWCRRRRAIAGLTVALVATVFGGLIATSLGWLAALQARDEARELTELGNQQMYDIRMESKWVSKFNEGLFGQISPKLDALLPAREGEIDCRGFEWFFWNRHKYLYIDYTRRHSEMVRDSTLNGHAGEVHGVAFSPDGKRLASASSDRTVKVWDVATWLEIKTLNGHAGEVHGVAFSPDGKRLASASSDRTVKVWDVATWLEIKTLNGHAGEVHGVAFSPNGKRLASASSDRTVKVWDVATWLEIKTLNGHAGEVHGVAFSPDGKRLASASSDRTVKVWDVATWLEIKTLNGHAGEVHSVAFSPDGKRLASASSGVKVWDSATWQAISIPKQYADEVHGVAFSPDGKRLASANQDGTWMVWNTATWRVILTAEAHFLSIDRGRRSSTGYGRRSSLGRRETLEMPYGGTPEDELYRTSKVYSVAFSSDGKWLASAGSDNIVKLWDGRPVDAGAVKSGPSPR